MNLLTARALLILALVPADAGLAHHTLTGIDLCTINGQVLPSGQDRLPQPDSAGARLVDRYCTQCHLRPGPGLHTGEEWPAVLDRMGLLMEVASRFGGGGVSAPSPDERDTLRDYLLAHALRPPAEAETATGSVGRAWALAPFFALAALGAVRWRGAWRRV